MILINGKELQTEQYPNRETKVKDFFADGAATVELKYNDDRDFVKLMFAKAQLDALGVSADLFIHYMPYSRMDRKIDGDMFTLKYVTDFISKLKFDNITVMEPHSAKTMELFADFGITVRDIYPTKEWVKNVMAMEQFGANDHVVFPDKGARQRYETDNLSNVLMFDKVRDAATGKIKGIDLTSGTVNKGSKCVIQDDLCSKGGTFMGVGKVLKERGADTVLLLVAHCEDTIFDGGILKDGSPIDTVYTTNSILTGTHPKIKIFDIKGERYEQKNL
jgi:ribose-phosphate pyrophosphokinase